MFKSDMHTCEKCTELENQNVKVWNPYCTAQRLRLRMWNINFTYFWMQCQISKGKNYNSGVIVFNNDLHKERRCSLYVWKLNSETLRSSRFGPSCLLVTNGPHFRCSSLVWPKVCFEGVSRVVLRLFGGWFRVCFWVVSWVSPDSSLWVQPSSPA